MICLTKEKYAKKIKEKRIKMFYIIANMSSRRCESYMMYLEYDSPHQVVMIVCELN